MARYVYFSFQAAQLLSEKTQGTTCKKHCKINEPKIPDLLKTMNMRKKNITSLKRHLSHLEFTVNYVFYENAFNTRWIRWTEFYYRISTTKHVQPDANIKAITKVLWASWKTIYKNSQLPTLARDTVRLRSELAIPPYRRIHQMHKIDTCIDVQGHLRKNQRPTRQQILKQQASQ